MTPLELIETWERTDHISAEALIGQLKAQLESYRYTPRPARYKVLTKSGTVVVRNSLPLSGIARNIGDQADARLALRVQVDLMGAAYMQGLGMVTAERARQEWRKRLHQRITAAMPKLSRANPDRNTAVARCALAWRTGFEKWSTLSDQRTAALKRAQAGHTRYDSTSPYIATFAKWLRRLRPEEVKP